LHGRAFWTSTARIAAMSAMHIERTAAGLVNTETRNLDRELFRNAMCRQGEESKVSVTLASELLD
jgi:hypothetical protein